MVQQLDRILRRALGAGRPLLALALALGCWAAAAPGLAAPPRSDEVTLYLGADFTGPSRAWSLQPDQPFLAVPYTGEDFQPAAGSIKLGADVGVLLFEAPFFSSVDDTCDYELGSPGAPERWWLSDGATVVPGLDESGEVEGNLKVQAVASLILYRRALGPPPGAMLLERRRYINWDCASPTKARGYKRLFVPVAAAPHRLGCFDLNTGLSYGAAGEVMLDFSAASELLLMAPRDLVADYAGVEHALEVALFDRAGCQGASVDFEDLKDGTRRFALKDLGFDRKARSVMIGYRRGAYDAMLNPPGEETETPATSAVLTAGVEETAGADTEVGAPAVEAEEVVESYAEAVVTMKAAEPIEATEAAETGQSAETGESAENKIPAESAAAGADPGTAAADEAGAVAESDAVGEEAPEEDVVGWIVGDRVVAAPTAETPSAQTPAAETPDESAGRAAEAGQIVAAESNREMDSGTLVTAAPAAPDEAAEQAALESVADAEPETAPDSASDEAPATGFLVLPESEPDAGTVGQTFKYPLLQGYRLSNCLYAKEDCGEPAASEWCKAKGYAGGASSWKIDENIGSLFPTLALGDSQLCASFICDGFQEITCVP